MVLSGRLGARLSVRGGSCDDVLHFLIIGKPAEFDACLLRSWKKPLAEKLSAPRAEPFAFV